MALVLSVQRGRRVYVGRYVRVAVVELDLDGAVLHVYRGDAEFRQRLAWNEELDLLDGAKVALGYPRDRDSVSLLFSAPRHIVVSRDDFTLKSHLMRQDRMEAEMEGRAE
jgi:sRNA-binding carbon storage regulator CsrA